MNSMIFQLRQRVEEKQSDRNAQDKETIKKKPHDGAKGKLSSQERERERKKRQNQLNDEYLSQQKSNMDAWLATTKCVTLETSKTSKK